jgi:hypothetical protein
MLRPDPLLLTPAARSDTIDIERRITMALDPELLAILACPYCKADVELTADGQGLKCVECHRVYPIQDDIPVMLIDEASIEPERETKG